MDMLSRRAKQQKLSPLQLFFQRARTLQMNDPEIISLAVGEPNAPTPRIVKSIGMSAIRSNQTRYTPAGGMMELRTIAADDFCHSGIKATALNTVVSAGSQPLIAAAILATTDPDDTVIVPAPYYPPYLALNKLFGVDTFQVDTSRHSFQFLGKTAEKIIPAGTKAIIFNSPNNPTGAVWNPIELLRLPKHLCIIADEAYQRICYDVDLISAGSIPELSDRVITIRSCSKSFNMSGWRIGYLTGPREVTEKIEIILEAILVSASAISQAAAIKAFTATKQIMARNLLDLRRRRDILVKWLNRHSLSFPPPQGAFYLFCNLPQHMALTSTALAELILEKAKVVVTPGVAFGDDRYIRISYASVASSIRLTEALTRIEKALEL